MNTNFRLSSCVSFEEINMQYYIIFYLHQHSLQNFFLRFPFLSMQLTYLRDVNVYVFALIFTNDICYTRIVMLPHR